MPAPTITIKQVQAQPILFIQRRVPATELQPLFAECFGKLYMHGHQAGLAIAGHPMARYVAIGAGLWTVDSIMPLLAPATSEGEMQAGYLADGEIVLAVHTGPYERLPESYVAIEQWLEAKICRAPGRTGSLMSLIRVKSRTRSSGRRRFSGRSLRRPNNERLCSESKAR